MAMAHLPLLLLAAFLACASAAEQTSVPPRTAEPVLYAHFVLMLVSWWLLLPLGVVFARRGRAGSGGADDAWFKLHKVCQYSGWALQLAGFACAVVYVQLYGTFGHFGGPHEIVGLAVVALGTLQPFNALLRPHKEASEAKSTARIVWEVVHKGIGYLLIGGAILTGALGLTYLPLLNYDLTTRAVALALAVVLGAFWFLVLVLSFTPAWPPVFRLFAKMVGAGEKSVSA
jgi:hypothetical protein